MSLQKQQSLNDLNNLKHVQQDVHVMRNRVQILRQQLQKEKDAIKKHKSMTDQMVKKKVEISKINSLKNKDSSIIQSQISHLRDRNYSYRESHKKQMDNILKAVYLVKLDEARQMKSISQQNKTVIQQRQRSLKAKQMQRRRDLQVQSENHKKRYLDYWKNKLNNIYSSGQKDRMEIQQEAQNKKNQLKNYQQQQIELLEEINRIHQEQNEAKKEYLAALTLSSKEVQQAFQKDDLKQSKSKAASPKNWEKEKEKEWEQKVQKLGGSRSEQRFKDHNNKDKDFWSKSPIVSIMSSHDIQIPRASCDPAKLKIILKELKRLEAKEQKQEERSQQRSQG